VLRTKLTAPEPRIARAPKLVFTYSPFVRTYACCNQNVFSVLRPLWGYVCSFASNDGSSY